MKTARRIPQPWIHSAPLDLALILAPPFLAVLGVLIAQRGGMEPTGVSLWSWVALVVGIDVSHVYSTIYRTYLSRERAGLSRLTLVAVPLAAWAVGFALYRWEGSAFWSAMAYLAVFHFVRQQYGFMMIYAREERGEGKSLHRRIDQLAIYMATLYPLIFWHTHLPRRFHWFIEGDFFGFLSRLQGKSLNSEVVDRLAFALFITALMAYFMKEVLILIRWGRFNWPKNLLFLGTVLSWYYGIVVLNGDLAFTVTNILAHGIPYISLVWIQGRRASLKSADKGWYALSMIPLFLGLLLLLSYFEEGLWDALVWREHGQVFSLFSSLPHLSDPILLAWVVPLLAVPQLTHYVLDGFIWKLRGNFKVGKPRG